MHRLLWHSMNVNKYLVLSIIFGVTTTSLFYTGYGVGDHIEQLPQIIRALNSDYLLNDFFTNAATNSVTRLWYSQFIAILAGSEQHLPAVFLVITLGSNIAISVITYIFASNLFRSSLVGIWASALTMSIDTFSLGWLTHIYQTTLIPSAIAIPFIFGSIYCLMQGKIIMAIFLGGISSLFHPLFGLEISVLVFTTHIIFHLIRKQKPNISTISALFLLIPFALVLLPQMSQQQIDSSQFIYIIAHFRHPHHYIPSTFSLFDFMNAAAFLIVVVIVYYKWLKANQNPFGIMPAIIVSLVLILCIGGYVFVELIPSRIWTTAQTYRLLYIVKWLGLIFVAGEIAQLPSSTQPLYASSVFKPLSLCVVALSQSFRGYFEQHGFHRPAKILNPTLVLLVAIFLLMVSKISLLSIVCLWFYVFLTFAFDVLSNKLRLIISAGIILAISVFCFYPRPLPYIEGKIDLINRIRQNFSFEIRPEIGDDGVSVAEFARENTPEQSVFLTPPRFGQFRLLANRAIVVDFKAFPFSDVGIEEWYERITTCYGTPSSKGFAMVGEMDGNYRTMNDNDLVSLQERYNFDYAILYSDTPTNFDVIFQNKTYKIVHLEKH